MRLVTKSLLTMLTILLSLLPYKGSSQTVLTLPQNKGSVSKTALANPQKKDSKSNNAIKNAAKDFKSPLPLYGLDDKMAYGEYTNATGQKPVFTFSAPIRKNPNAAEDSTIYTYTGFNQAAGLKDDGTTVTGGMVNFNLQPFACDTVSSHNGLSPYSYIAKGKLYCLLPVYDVASGKYTKITRTIYDANTLKMISQKTFDNVSGDQSYVPYIISYDDQRDVVYAISMGDNGSDGEGSYYYLNILDTTNCKLQRLGLLGKWIDGHDNNYTVKGFTAGYGTLYAQLIINDAKLYIATIDPTTCATKIIGSTSMPTQYVYGLQPMIYDSSQGSLLVNHFDFNNGTVYYKVSPFVPYGAKEDTCKTVLIENAPTGFSFFYKRPAVDKSISYKDSTTLANITDLNVTCDDNGTATISFTIPTKRVDGKDIVFPSYAAKNLRCYVYEDNNYVSPTGMPASFTYGQSVSCSLSNVTSGLHTFTISLYPLWYELGGTRAGKTITCGYDAPADVLNPTLTIDGLKATVKWDAPTKGRYDDFGSKFDASNITYTVVRNTDNKVIAKDITETTATDETLSEEINTYYYTIYATSQGQQNLGTVTNSVSGGLYLALPYENDFSNYHSLDGWTILNLDIATRGSANTWSWNTYYDNLASGWGMSDDWAITPPFNLKADSLYMLSYNLKGAGNLTTTIGKGNTAEVQTNILDDFQDYTTHGTETKRYYYRPTNEGRYNLGLYNYNLTDEQGWNVDTLIVKAVAPVSAPDKVRNLTFTPDANGALGGTLTFKLPSINISGNAITSLTKVTAYDNDGAELANSTNIKPGDNVSLKVKAVQGWNTFRVVAANENGEGWPVELSKFIGPDVPVAINNLTLKWGEEQNIASLSWEAPSEGVNGGYVDPSTYTYTIYKYDSNTYPQYSKLGESGNETAIDVQIKDASSAQDQYVFAVTATNVAGESDYVKGGIVLGKPYTMPFAEPFTTKGIYHSPWLIANGKNSQAWTLDEGYFNEKIQPENKDSLQLLLRNVGTEDGSSRFITPIIDLTNASNPVLSVWLHHSDGMSDKAYVTVDASIDGSKNYIAVSDTARISGNNGWTEHLFNLSSLKGKKAQIALDGYMPDASTRIFADNWNIYEASGKDLAITAISQPMNPTAGQTATISATITNKGAETAKGYSVMFTVNNEVIAEEDPDGELAPAASRIVNFTLPMTSAAKDIIYSAQVSYDGDENLDNNQSSEVEINAKQLDLAAPNDLTLNGDYSLLWTAPEVSDGRNVTLDFEDVPAFTIDNIDNWTTYDGDGHLTSTFVQYYGNYWPYANQPLAWMTWSAKEAGCSTATIWTAYEGDKCLIHWGNYGVDANGRPNTDPDDDWFISPEVKGGSDISFMTLSNDAGSSIEILTSSTDNKLSSFTNKVSTVTYPTASTWNEVKATLPADAKYVAIHTVLDNFGIMIDNIKYTEAKSPVLKGYNVYCNNAAEGSTTSTKANAAALGTYAVSAVYDLGESPLSNTVSVVTGINDASADNVKVIAGKGTITVTGAEGMNIELFNVGGQKCAANKARMTETYNVAKGMYIININGKTHKVIVR